VAVREHVETVQLYAPRIDPYQRYSEAYETRYAPQVDQSQPQVPVQRSADNPYPRQQPQQGRPQQGHRQDAHQQTGHPQQNHPQTVLSPEGRAQTRRGPTLHDFPQQAQQPQYPHHPQQTEGAAHQSRRPEQAPAAWPDVSQGPGAARPQPPEHGEQPPSRGLFEPRVPPTHPTDDQQWHSPGEPR
jgi:hypothetical protein